MSVILELHSSDLVSFVISDRLVLSMVMDMLDYAARQLAPRGGSSHSPFGSGLAVSTQALPEKTE